MENERNTNFPRKIIKKRTFNKEKKLILPTTIHFDASVEDFPNILQWVCSSRRRDSMKILQLVMILDLNPPTLVSYVCSSSWERSFGVVLHLFLALITSSCISRYTCVEGLSGKKES